MLLADLPNRLAALRVRPDAYDTSGGNKLESYGLRRASSGWEVFYSERGQKTGRTTFTDEEAACAFFSALIEADRISRSD